MANRIQQDLIYAECMNSITEFAFDDKVAAVFEDMINRSVPGYTTIIRMIGLLASKHLRPNGRCYDLGCSLGAAALAMGRVLDPGQGRVIAVDNSFAMISQARDKITLADCGEVIDLVCCDVEDMAIRDADMVALNFTLQFIAIDKRRALLQKIFDGMSGGGLLILSEKIRFEDAQFDELFIDMHHQFKSDQGYSDLEISQKRTALENVLLPESLEVHGRRLSEVGFKRFAVWFQCFNFVSLIAVK